MVKDIDGLLDVVVASIHEEDLRTKGNWEAIDQSFGNVPYFIDNLRVWLRTVQKVEQQDVEMIFNRLKEDKFIEIEDKRINISLYGLEMLTRYKTYSKYKKSLKPSRFTNFFNISGKVLVVLTPIAALAFTIYNEGQKNKLERKLVEVRNLQSQVQNTKKSNMYLLRIIESQKDLPAKKVALH